LTLKQQERKERRDMIGVGRTKQYANALEKSLGKGKQEVIHFF
jgi:hypothetical protein